MIILQLLSKYRKRALEIMRALKNAGLDGMAVHGSIARGDVGPNSDIDIIFQQPISSFRVELAIQSYGVQERQIVQSTPNQSVKGVLELKDSTTVSFPMVPLRQRDVEFPRFSGLLDFQGLLNGDFVPGVNKELLLIEPDPPRGYWTSSIIGKENSVAKLLGISQSIVEERVRVLRRRDKLGRTGVFLTRILGREESFEKVLHNLQSSNPAVRRLVRRRLRYI